MLQLSMIRTITFPLCFLMLVLCACPVRTDLGTPCTLVKRNPDGGNPISMREGEIPDGGRNTDFISFGATECEDLVCVRDGNLPLSGRPETTAVGYCSRSCVPTSSIGCPAKDSHDDKDPTKKLSCRSLLLDEQTLAFLRTNDPSKYHQYFGESTSPFFCARTAGGDAGT